jgi:hypothetical protein
MRHELALASRVITSGWPQAGRVRIVGSRSRSRRGHLGVARGGAGPARQCPSLGVSPPGSRAYRLGG